MNSKSHYSEFEAALHQLKAGIDGIGAACPNEIRIAYNRLCDMKRDLHYHEVRPPLAVAPVNGLG